MPFQLPFLTRKPTHYEHLKKKWTHTHYKLQEQLWKNHQEALETFLSKPKRFVMGALAGAIMISTPATHVGAAVAMHQTAGGTFRDVDKKTFLLTDLYTLLPHEVRPLTTSEENNIATMLSDAYGVKVTAQLNGIRLNRSYGYIGQEQHLARFPGDTMDTHFDREEDAQQYYKYGMAPGLGAWRYFAPSQQDMTKEDELREKWYIAVPTFLSPGFHDHIKEYGDFFKYRKMLVVNPTNGKAVIADIADSGPSEWTGKHLGGSPEVMKYLERVDGAQKGPVLYFFVDDSAQEHVPLGPIEL